MTTLTGGASGRPRRSTPDRETAPLFIETEVDPPVVEVVRWVSEMVPPQNMFYSQRPAKWADAGDVEYVVKGPEVSVVVAELVSYMLARLLAVRVPDFAVIRTPESDQPHFGSKYVETAYRDVDAFLKNGNPGLKDDLARIIVLDVWLVNPDRNIGNLLVAPNRRGPGREELVAIDFERSVAVGSDRPFTACADIATARLLPKEVLAPFVRGIPLPSSLVRDVKNFSDENVREVVSLAGAKVGDAYSWSDSTVGVLTQRRNRLEQLLGEVWS